MQFKLWIAFLSLDAQIFLFEDKACRMLSDWPTVVAPYLFLQYLDVPADIQA